MKQTFAQRDFSILHHGDVAEGSEEVLFLHNIRNRRQGPNLQEHERRGGEEEEGGIDCLSQDPIVNFRFLEKWNSVLARERFSSRGIDIFP
jgi:hypothetical protein